MGYTVATSAMSGKAKTEMLEFMGEHFRPASAFIDKVEHDPSRSGPLTEEHLSYDEGSSKIGFNYSVSVGPAGTYIYCVCRWMALKVGRKRRFAAFGIPDTSAPYYVYDGHEAQPVLARSEWEGVLEPDDDVRFVNDLGMYEKGQHARMLDRRLEQNPDHLDEISEGHRKELNRMIEREKQGRSEIEEELSRLDDLWTSRG